MKLLQGLDDGQVQRNVEKYGKNELTPPKKDPTWLKFIKTLVGGFQLLLWAGSFLSFAAYVAVCFQSDNPPSDNVIQLTNYFSHAKFTFKGHFAII